MRYLLLASMLACAPHDQMAQALEKNHKEVVTDRAVASNGWLAEIYRSESGSWTMTLTNPQNGLSCIRAAGQGWQHHGLVPIGDPA